MVFTAKPIGGIGGVVKVGQKSRASKWIPGLKDIMAIVAVVALGLIVPEQAKAQTCNGYSSVVPDSSRGWTATWFDDFNSFDATKWSKHESTNEAMKANAIWVPSKVTTSGGNLHINGAWNTGTGEYVSGFVSTLPRALNFQVPITASHPLYAYREGGSQYATQGFSFKYGLVEFCAKLPSYLNGTTPTTAGIHSSLWLMPTDLSWPPEIDVADAFNEPGNNGIGTSLPYLISGTYPNNVNWPDLVMDALAMDPYINQYALYAMEWTDSELRFFINNTLVRVFNSSSPAGAYALGQVNSKAGFYLLMDQSLAEIYHQPFQTATGTSDLEVDWVKVSYSPSSPAGWTPCANEWGTCSFSGTKQVRFGVGTTWKTQTATNSIACDIYIFGDPAPGQVKTCQVESSSSPTWDPLRQ